MAIDAGNLAALCAFVKVSKSIQVSQMIVDPTNPRQSEETGTKILANMDRSKT